MADIPDFQERAQQRLITQYRESARLIEFVRNLTAEANSLGEMFRALIEDRTIENSTGKTLDILGEIVGRSREVDVDVFTAAFAYRDLDGRFPLNTFGYGTLSDPEAGAPYISVRDATQSTTRLNDAQYRIAIRAQILRNYSRGKPEEVISFVKLISGDIQVALEEHGNANGVVRLGAVMGESLDEVALAAQFIPKPIGVGMDIVSFVYEDGPFAFAGFPGAGSFGDATDSSVGGRFVEYF